MTVTNDGEQTTTVRCSEGRCSVGLLSLVSAFFFFEEVGGGHFSLKVVLENRLVN